ncbi:PEP-CTERM sorting domain-containing protein [Candidatus Scalindua japonica]|uniref:PEP-CTERM sorting domain-containing protein n=1 Tax=Candidatus Scalindua japonica TaxID=1284222 RepID=UPI000BDFAA08|nr:PEP-CTERM sorting domain-containing protein [Candidatus Scalindua japonica]
MLPHLGTGHSADGNFVLSEIELAATLLSNRETLAATIVPEPATVCLLGIGLAGMGGVCIRKRLKRLT